MTKSYLTVTDLFCGAGGSSDGALHAGVEIRHAANHWKLACETYAKNHRVDPACADISQTNARAFDSTDILIASPECTNHSLAKGVKRKNLHQESLFGCDVCRRHGESNCPKHSDPVKRSRAGGWDVARFVEHHRYAIVVVENVVDWIEWEDYGRWWKAMERLGYRGRCVYLNSMFALPAPDSILPPAPQSRDRIYVVWWRKGNRAPDLDVCPVAFCLRCATNIEAVQTFKPRSSPKARYGRQYLYKCPRCAAEVRPYYYAALNAIDWSIPAQRIGDREKPLKPRTTGRLEYGARKYGRRALLITTNMTSDGGRSRPLHHPAFTQTGSNLTALASPFLVETAFSHSSDSRASAISDAMPTQSTRQTAALVAPSALVVAAGSRAVDARDVAQPLPTMTGSERFALAGTPFLVHTRRNDSADCRVRPTTGPAGTQTGHGDFGLAIPPGFVASLRGTGDDQVPYTSSPLDASLGTVSAGGVHAALVTAAAVVNLRDYRSVEQLVEPVDAPLPTQVAAPQTAILQRAPFLVSYYGGSNVAASIAEATTAVTSTPRHSLVEPDGDEIDIRNWFFRMLRAHEIGRAMAFRDDYVVLGTDRDKVKQYGNAVTPPVMELLIRRCVESLHPEVAA